MSGASQSRARPISIEKPRPQTVQTGQNSASIVLPQHRRSTFVDRPFHGVTEVKDPEFRPPTPSKQLSVPQPTPERAIPPLSLAASEDPSYASGQSRMPSIGSQISQVGSVSAGMTGLKNLGNTCYMNSVLQCLSATVPFASYFLSIINFIHKLTAGGRYRRSININNPLGSKGTLANSFAELLKHLWSDQYTHISPISLRVYCDRLSFGLTFLLEYRGEASTQV